MADQNITALPKKTSSQLAATDYLLGIDSAEGYQMLIQDLGDYIIQHATSSLAGSSQTLASAISALNSKLTQVVNPSEQDTNKLIAPGWYTLGNTSGRTNLPTNTAGILIVDAAPPYIYQTYTLMSEYEFQWHRVSANSGSTWTAWTQHPTRTEITTLNNRFVSEYWAAGTTSKTYSLTARKAYLLVASNMSSTQNPVNTHISIVQAGTNASSTPAVYTLVNGSYWTVTAEANNTITVTGVYAYDQVSLIQL